MCPNTDRDIELPHLKCLYHSYKDLTSLYLPAEGLIPLFFHLLNIMLIKTEAGTVYIVYIH